MTLTLNIYDDKMKKIVKTYTAEEMRLKFGVIEDLLELIDADKFTKGTNAEITKMALILVTKGKDSIIELLKNTFEGVTDTEMRNTDTAEIVGLVVRMIQFTVSEMSRIIAGKN